MLKPNIFDYYNLGTVDSMSDVFFSLLQFVSLDVDGLAKQLEPIISPMQHHFSYKPGAYYNHALFFLSLAMPKVMPELKKVCDSMMA